MKKLIVAMMMIVSSVIGSQAHAQTDVDEQEQEQEMGHNPNVPTLMMISDLNGNQIGETEVIKCPRWGNEVCAFSIVIPPMSVASIATHIHSGKVVAYLPHANDGDVQLDVTEDGRPNRARADYIYGDHSYEVRNTARFKRIVRVFVKKS